MAPADKSPKTPSPEQTSGTGCLLRLVWMVAGNGVVLMSGIYIALSEGGFSHVDALFWSGAIVLVGARLLDIARFHGLTANGTPATMSQGVRYSVIVVLLSVVLWFGAHAVAGTFSA